MTGNTAEKRCFALTGKKICRLVLILLAAWIWYMKRGSRDDEQIFEDMEGRDFEDYCADLLDAKGFENVETTPCINCSRCSYACPAGLVPGRLSDMAEHFDSEAFVANGGMECCECGCCSFVCPAKKPLTQNIKSMRKMELAKRKK